MTLRQAAARAARTFKTPHGAKAYARLLRRAMSVQEAKQTLGFDPSATLSPDEVSKAYKQLALKHHPDRGGDAAKMVELNVAKEILEGKRKPDALQGAPSYRATPQQRREERKVEIGWKEASSLERVPHDVEWKFKTRTVSVSLDAVDANGHCDGFVVYGKAPNHHVFVACEHYVYESPYDSASFDQWTMSVFKYPLTTPLATLAPKALKRGFEVMIRLRQDRSKPNVATGNVLLKEGTPWTEALPKSVKAQNLSLKEVLTLIGEPPGGKPSDKEVKAKKVTVMLLLGKRYDNHFYRGPSTPKEPLDLHAMKLLVNNVSYDLHPDSEHLMQTTRFGGKSFLTKVFGDYYYPDSRKMLTRLAGGHELLAFMSKNLTKEPPALLALLAEAAAQGALG